MEVEFDPVKRQATLTNRGLDMSRAGEIFAGNTLSVEDLRKPYTEKRYITIGYLDQRMVVLVWTPRGLACRIISLRKANAKEQRIYASRLGRP